MKGHHVVFHHEVGGGVMEERMAFDDVWAAWVTADWWQALDCSYDASQWATLAFVTVVTP